MGDSSLFEIFGLIAMLLTGFTLGLRITNLDLPDSVHNGESIWINCSYELEVDQLYSIKWYKNDVEFYRFIPNDVPRAKAYECKGIYSDLSKSEAGHIFLTTSDLNTEGLFRCEVSAEAPSFQTVKKEKELKVYYLPIQGEEVVISGLKSQYNVGELVQATCFAGDSRPRADLQWSINEHPAPEEFLSPDNGNTMGSNEFGNTSLSLNFFAESQYFINGTIALSCVSTIRLNYNESSQVSLVSNSRHSSQEFYTETEGEGTVIKGMQSNYSIGEIIELTCATTKAKGSSTELVWFINSNEATSDMLETSLNTIEGGPDLKSLTLRIHLSPEFVDIWSVLKKKRLVISLKCVAKYTQILSVKSIQENIRQFQASNKLQIQENQVGAVHMKSGGHNIHGPSLGVTWFSLFVILFLGSNQALLLSFLFLVKIQFVSTDSPQGCF